MSIMFLTVRMMIGKYNIDKTALETLFMCVCVFRKQYGGEIRISCHCGLWSTDCYSQHFTEVSKHLETHYYRCHAGLDSYSNKHNPPHTSESERTEWVHLGEQGEQVTVNR